MEERHPPYRSPHVQRQRHDSPGFLAFSASTPVDSRMGYNYTPKSNSGFKPRHRQQRGSRFPSPRSQQRSHKDFYYHPSMVEDPWSSFKASDSMIPLAGSFSENDSISETTGDSSGPPLSDSLIPEIGDSLLNQGASEHESDSIPLSANVSS